MVTLTITLLLAHILGDFILQPKHWVEGKLKKKQYSKYLYFHILIHAVLLLFAFQLDFVTYWHGYLFIILTHLIIDIFKSTSQTEENKRTLFFLDQLAHLLVLLLVVLVYKGDEINSESIFHSKVQVLIIAVLVVTKVASILIDVFISKWQIKTNPAEEESLADAGKYIGVLERLLIFFFIVIGHWEGVGFLLAAKSIFRFGDLTKAKDRKLTEYILIGTLLSFGVAMLTGYFYVEIIKVL